MACRSWCKHPTRKCNFLLGVTEIVNGISLQKCKKTREWNLIEKEPVLIKQIYQESLIVSNTKGRSFKDLFIQTYE